MVAGLAFVATAVATLFAQATAVRWSRSRAPHQGAWTIALALFALASAALATGASTGWDRGTFRAFYLLGAIVNVPWLALGTIYLLLGRHVGDRVRIAVVLFTGLGLGVLLQGIVGHDEAFALTLAAGIAVIYAGFAVASGVRISLNPRVDVAASGDPADAQSAAGSERRNSLPANDRGSSSTSSTRVGRL